MMEAFPTYCCGLGLLLGAVVPMQGQVTDSLPAPTDTLRVEAAPVTVRADVVRLPFTVSQIPYRALQDVREPTIEPVINSMPGVWMQTGALNTNRINIRGVGYREPFATSGIKVYLDEIPLTNGAGEASIEDIHPLVFDNMRVWRGPGSAVWGAGLGGMIHLQTRLPQQTSWETRLSGGSFGRWQVDQHVDLVGEGRHETGVMMHYQGLHDDGFRENNAYRRHSVTVKPAWSNRKGLRIQAFGHWIDLRAEIPSSLNASDYADHPDRAAPTWQAVNGREDYVKWIGGLHWQYARHATWAYSGALFFTDFTSNEVRPFNVLDESSSVWGMRHRVSWSPGRRIDLQGGFEYFNEAYANRTYEVLPDGGTGQALGSAEEKRQYGQFFAQAEATAGTRWTFLGGLHMAVTVLEADGQRGTVPPSLFPMAGAGYAILDDLVVTAQLSRGYSALSADDVRNADGTFDPDIVPETGWSRELSLRAGRASGSYIVVSAFIMDIENTILTRRLENDVFVRLNGGSSRHAGPEIEYSLGGTASRIQWQGAYTYSAHTFRTFVDAAGDYSGNRLPGIPRHNLYSSINVRPPGWPAFYIEHRWLSELYLDDANTVTAEGYSVFHAGLRWETPIARRWRARWMLDLHNVFGTRYASMFQINAPGLQPRYYYPAKPRAIYVGVAFSPGQER
jgi:iron complex outermembrane receptor protein